MTVEESLQSMASALTVHPPAAFGDSVRERARIRRRRRRAAVGSGAVVVSALGVAGVLEFPDGTSRSAYVAAEPTSSPADSPSSGAAEDAAADAQLRAARYFYAEIDEDEVNPGQPATHDVMQIWSTHDGSPFRVLDNGKPVDVTGKNHVGGYGGRKLTWDDLATLPTDIPTLKAGLLSESALDPGDTPDDVAFSNIAGLLAGTPMPSAQRHALMQTAASIAGGRLTNQQTGGVIITSPSGHESLEFDARDYLVEEDTSDAAGVTQRLVVLAHGPVDSEGSTLPAGPVPTPLG